MASDNADVRRALTPTPAGVRLNIRVIPRASRTVVGGVRDGRLVVRVTAPPVDRAANEAALTALALALGVPARSLILAAGATARNKTVEVRNVTAAELRMKLDALAQRS